MTRKILVYPVIATRGRLKWLHRQLSVLVEQLLPGEQIIVVPDGCRETTAAMMNGEFSQYGDGVLVVPMAKHVGVYYSRRIGNSLVPTDGVVCEIDDHDIAKPTLLAKLRETFSNSDVMMAYCDVEVTDPEYLVPPRKMEKDPDKKSFAMYGQLGYGMKAYRKWVYDAVGGYPLEFEVAGDYALMCKMEALFDEDKSAIAHIREVLVTVVEDVTGISRSRSSDQQRCVDRVVDAVMNKRLALPYRLVHAPGAKSIETIEELNIAVKPINKPDVLPPKPGKVSKPVILHLADYIGFGRGGGELSLMYFLRKSAEAGYRVVIACGKVLDQTEVENHFKWAEVIKLSGMECLRPDQDILPAEISAVLRKVNPDVVVTEATIGALIGKASREAGFPVVPIVQFWRGVTKLDDDTYAALHERPVTRCIADNRGEVNLPACKAVIANSRFTKEVLSDVLGVESYVVFPPIDRKSAVASSRTPEYVVCTTTQTGKSADVFVELARLNPGVKFMLLTGDAKINRGEGIVEKAKKLSNITVVEDWIFDMKTVYATARAVFVGTRTCETFCRVVAEAMANGIPVLASKAGNINYMVKEGENGILVNRNAPVDEWNAALQKVLQLNGTEDSSFCRDDSVQFMQVLESARNLREIGAFLPTGAPGVWKLLNEVHAEEGITLLPWETKEMGNCQAVILPASMDSRLDAEAGTSRAIGYLWCSHFAQMDSSRHEITALSEVIKNLQNPRRFLLTTYQPDMVAMQKCGLSNVLWFPPIVPIPSKPASHQKFEGRHVFIPGPYGIRKNIFASLVAAHAAGAHVHVTDWAARVPEFVELVRVLGIKATMHACKTTKDVERLAGQCGAAVCMSHSETFGYGVIEVILSGTPVISWKSMPCLDEYHGRAIVADPNDPVGISGLLATMLDKPLIAKGTMMEQFATLSRLMRISKQAVRSTLLEMLK